MALKLSQKKEVITEVSEIAHNSSAVVVAEYSGLSVKQMYSLRMNAREQNVQVRVVKNTLAKIALKDTLFADLEEALVGQVVLIFGQNDLSSAAKVSLDFSKENEDFKVKALTLGSGLLPGSDLKSIASLPTRDEALSILMRVMLAPVENLARAFNDMPTKIVRVFSLIQSQKST